jgi:Txe/YoeB family toxin of toxin-antitoxin system
MEELVREGHGKKLDEILKSMEKDPFYHPPRYEKLNSDLMGFYSRRINVKHRLVFKVVPSEEFEGEVLVLRMRGHYKEIYSWLIF